MARSTRSRKRRISQDERPKCRYCKEPLAGGPGTWWSTLTQMEVCTEALRQKAKVPFHEPPETEPLDEFLEMEG